MPFFHGAGLSGPLAFEIKIYFASNKACIGCAGFAILPPIQANLAQLGRAAHS